jgi:PAS domain S-box-containing protein
VDASIRERELALELSRTREQLADAESTLEAIRTGRVDAVVVDANGGQDVYTLESTELPYRQFLEQMAEGAISLDGTGTILYSNRFFCELIGAPRERVIGTELSAFVADDSLETFRAALSSDERSRLSLDLRDTRGRRVPVQLASTPAGAGPWRRLTVVATDLSERERFRELTVAQEAAESASVAKDQFLAAVGHELRTPLSVVIGWTTYLLNQPEVSSPRCRKALETIYRNAELQRKLIEDLLDISRIVSGKLRIERQDVDLAEIARGVEASMALAADSKNVSLELEVDETVRVLGDPGRLEQVLQNVLGNAIKFTESGGRVRLRVERVGDRARVTVQDNGKGIEPELLPRIFEIFRQGHDLRRAEKGLGLGLSIANRLVELHEGSISVESAGLGRGATFTIEVPATPAAGRVEAHFAPEPRHDRSLLRDLRIVVVDDEKDVRELTSRVLEDRGAEVVAAVDAAQALARLKDERFDLVITDIMMPGTSGFELARELRRRHGTALPIIALSAVPLAEHRAGAEPAPFSAYLVKPLDEAVLVRAVKNALDFD